MLAVFAARLLRLSLAAILLLSGRGALFYSHHESDDVIAAGVGRVTKAPQQVAKRLATLGDLLGRSFPCA